MSREPGCDWQGLCIMPDICAVLCWAVLRWAGLSIISPSAISL